MAFDRLTTAPQTGSLVTPALDWEIELQPARPSEKHPIAASSPHFLTPGAYRALDCGCKRPSLAGVPPSLRRYGAAGSIGESDPAVEEPIGAFTPAERFLYLS